MIYRLKLNQSSNPQKVFDELPKENECKDQNKDEQNKCKGWVYGHKHGHSIQAENFGHVIEGKKIKDRSKNKIPSKNANSRSIWF